MNELVFMNCDNKPVTTSLKIAEIFGKDHDKVMRKVREKQGLFGAANFGETYYEDSQGKEQPMFYLDRDFTTYLIMGFTGAKADEWKLKYIQAFNEMEKTLKKPLSAIDQIKLLNEATVEVNEKVDAVIDDLKDFKQTLPLLGVDMDEIKYAKNHKVVPLLGGKDSNAYKNRSLTKKVYRDLETQIRREFGVCNYKAIKRNQVEQVKQIINDYELPLYLKEQIDDENAQERFL